MKHKIQILSLLMVILQSCILDNQTNNNSKNEKYSNDSIRAIIFKIAYNNKSTTPSYIVFNAKDLNTGLTKEICCEAPFLSGAMHLELNISYDKKGSKYIDSIILVKRQTVFKFKNKEALNNINFYDYPDKKSINKIAEKNNLNYYVEKYINDSIRKLIHFKIDTGYIKESFAHIMFKSGIITSRDCIIGNDLWIGIPNLSIPKTPKLKE